MKPFPELPAKAKPTTKYSAMVIVVSTTFCMKVKVIWERNVWCVGEAGKCAMHLCGNQRWLTDHHRLDTH
jgi:hypothetical protein